MEVSKSSVDRAGETLRQRHSDEAALDILAACRNKHIYVLNLAFKLLKRQTDKVGNHAIYGQRLKRVSSILHKLARLPNAKLSRLQDIGGCRVILSDYEKLRALYAGLKKSKLILPNYKDYITYPKNDGYRSIHLIYQCGSRDIEYAGLKIEFQLRTKLQHAWATAVEIIDSFEGEQLKLGKGSEKWQRFFYLVADEFARLENLPLHDNTIMGRLDEIKQLCKDLNVINKLNGYAHISKIVENKKDKQIKDAKFFILILFLKKNPPELRRMSFKDQIEAQNAYIALEKGYINNPSVNILMVKMDSIKQIKKSYPNYFADSKIFWETLTSIVAK
jgi:ppGpp synthetase/RelA/SpoT-type nucleotidyltranferase